MGLLWFGDKWDEIKFYFYLIELFDGEKNNVYLIELGDIREK